MSNIDKILNLRKEMMKLCATLKANDLYHFVNQKEYIKYSNKLTEIQESVTARAPWQKVTENKIDTTEVENYIKRKYAEIESNKKLIDGVWTTKTLPNNMKQVMFTFDDEREQN